MTAPAVRQPVEEKRKEGEEERAATLTETDRQTL